MTVKQFLKNLNNYLLEGDLEGLERMNYQLLISTSKDSSFMWTLCQDIEKKLGLSFVPQQTHGNLCFVNNNTEMRDEFKLSFTAYDILDYCYAAFASQTHEIPYPKKIEIPIPNDMGIFWKMVKQGHKIQEIILSKPIETNNCLVLKGEGNFKIDNVITIDNHKIFINKTQYFENPEEFQNIKFIEKWLKSKIGQSMNDEMFNTFDKTYVLLIEFENIAKQSSILNQKPKAKS